MPPDSQPDLRGEKAGMNKAAARLEVVPPLKLPIFTNFPFSIPPPRNSPPLR